MELTNVVTAWSGDAPLVGLPRQFSRLVGRERELDTLHAVIGEDGARLVTLIGPGGIGKTRLALAVAGDLAPRFDRVQFLPLVTVLETSAVPGIIAARLGLREAGLIGVPAALEEAFTRDRTLLVLDNLEHLPDATGMVADLLAMPSPPTIIATSRIRLGLPDEVVFAVPPLLHAAGDSPEAALGHETPAATLFLERVREQHPGFVLTPERLADIRAICQALEGLPLAIELAAARCRILTPHELRQRLHHALDILAGDSPAHAEHQRTIRRTIAWSVDLLEPSTRDGFEQLAAFGGSFASDAVAAVIERDETATAVVLSRLLEHHLVVPDRSLPSVDRFRLPSAIREFAVECLASRTDLNDVLERMAMHVHQFVLVGTQGLRGPDIAEWTQRLDVEMGNVVRGMAWLEEQQRVDALFDILIWMQPHWLVRGRYDITDVWLERGLVLVESEQAPDRVRQDGLFVACSRMALGRGDVVRARELIDRATGDVDHLWTRAKVTEQRGMVLLRSGDYLAALRQFEMAREASQQLGNQEAEAWALHGMAAAWLDLGAMEQATQTLALARECYLASNNAHGVALVDDSLSQSLHGQGRTAEAQLHAERALAVFQLAANHRRAGIALDNIGRYARERGDLERARLAHLEACDLYRQAGDPSSFVAWLRRVVALMVVAGDQDAAARLMTLVHPLQQRYGGRITLPEVRELDRLQPEPATVDHPAQRLPVEVPLPRAGLDDAIDLATSWLRQPLAQVPVRNEEVLGMLTRREREIVELLVEGLTDQQIADRLGISIRTVGKHLSTAYGRLGVSSRKDAARLVAGG